MKWICKLVAEEHAILFPGVCAFITMFTSVAASPTKVGQFELALVVNEQVLRL